MLGKPRRRVVPLHRATVTTLVVALAAAVALWPGHRPDAAKAAEHIPPRPQPIAPGPSVARDVAGPWHAVLRRTLTGAPITAAADGKDLIVNSHGSLLRLDPRTGAIATRAKAPNVYPWAVIGRVLLLRPHPSAQGAAVVIARRTASALQPLAPWRIAFPHGAGADGLGYAASSATSRLYFGLGDTIAVVDAESGRVLSRHHVDGSVDSLAVSLHGDEVYAATQAGNPTVDHLLAMDPRTGSLRWDRVQDGPIGVLGAFPGGVVVASYGGMGATAWLASASDGRQIGDRDVADFGGGSFAGVASNARHTVISSHGMVCVDPLSGQRRASASSPHDIGTVTFVDGDLYGVIDSGSGPSQSLVAFRLPAAC